VSDALRRQGSAESPANPRPNRPLLDRYLHAGRAPVRTWTDFPPAASLPLLDLPPFDNPVRWND